MTLFIEVHRHNPYLELLDYADTLPSFSDERYRLIKLVFAWTYCTEVIEGAKSEDIHPILYKQTVANAHHHRLEVETELSKIPPF